MPNRQLTPLMITNEALSVLHGELSFLKNVNRQYDNRFAQSGAKIGQTLNIRMPPKYKTRTGTTFSGQDHYERSTPLSVTSQIGIDLSFTSVEMTMELDGLRAFLRPAMAQLAADIEYDCLTRAKNLISNFNGTTTTSGQLTFKQFDDMGAILTRNLAARTDRVALLAPGSRVEFNDATKGLFQASSNIAEQYREGMIGRTSGFDVFESTFLPTHTTGTLAGTPLLTGATLGLTTTSNEWTATTILQIDGATSATTLLAGDIITLGAAGGTGVYDVHPETKDRTSTLKRFVVQSSVTLTTSANAYAVTVRPALIHGAGNAYRNCSLNGTTSTDNVTVTLIGNTGTTYGQNIAFHKDAFVFATADLVDVSQYGAFGARQTMDGISMRLVQQYDVASDTVPARFDVLYGFGPLYQELAVRNWYTSP